MIIERMPDPIDALVITETFYEHELSNIYDELRVLKKHDDGGGVWLTDIYKNLDTSFIHLGTLDAFFNEPVVEALISINSAYGVYLHVNNHSTVVRNFGDESSFPLRIDGSAFTVMTFLFDEPKNFTGGNVTLQIGAESAYEKDIENNMTIIFPSSYAVGLSDIKLNDKDGSGLCVITSYLFIESR